MSEARTLRFGAFELDTASGELRHRGAPVKLPPQPFKVLDLLARHSGQVLTRQEIREHVWCGDTFVDFEQGLNFCIRQIREALGDTADAPHFIETLPRRGYRFLMPVDIGTATPPRPSVTRLIVLPFRMLRPDPDTDFLTFSLPDAITSSLSGLESLVVRSSMAALRYAGDHTDPKRIANEMDVDAIVTGTLLRAGDRVRLTSQLTEAASGTLLWSDSAEAPVGDLFAVQDELTRRIVASLSLPLTAKERQMLYRDVPANAKAYEYFLRGNQFSCDSKQWVMARDVYTRSVEEDPRYAPAWARLGRIQHVIAKYLPSGTKDGLSLAEAAFERALAINPDLALTHKMFAQLEVDLGRARDSMSRLVERAHVADPEILTGLVTTCRYCGLLDASVAAHERAIGLEPKIRTSVGHTWFVQGDYARVVTARFADFPYVGALALAALGRTQDAVTQLCDLEAKTTTRLRDFMAAARCLLEGDKAGSLAAIDRILTSDFRDPEGLFYLSRHLAHLDHADRALALFERVVGGGYYCYPAMDRDPWLNALRAMPAFTTLMKRVEAEHRHALHAFERLDGMRTLGAATTH